MPLILTFPLNPPLKRGTINFGAYECLYLLADSARLESAAAADFYVTHPPKSSLTGGRTAVLAEGLYILFIGIKNRNSQEIAV